MAAPPRSQSQASHKDREHDRYRSAGHSEAGHGQTKPNDFVEDAAKPGNTEEEKQPAHQETSAILVATATTWPQSQTGELKCIRRFRGTSVLRRAESSIRSGQIGWMTARAKSIVGC